MCQPHDHASRAPAALEREPTAGGCRPPLLTRRGFVIALVGLSGQALIACAGPNGIGLQLVSEAEVERLGLQTWQQIRAETPASRNRTYQAAVQRVGGSIVRAARENPRTWEMVVFQGEEANAFALPGNKIGIYEGMFRHTRDDALLAVVLGHEVGHNQANHATQRVNAMAATQIGTQLIAAALQVGDVGAAQQIAAVLGAGLHYGIIMPYSRSQELEADEIGVFNMARAGYDPRAAVALWADMQSGPRVPAFLSTHPAPAERIRRLEALMPRALAVYRG